MEEKKIIEFYEDFVELLIHTPNLSDKIFCEFVNALLCGHELESSGDCSLELYEYILTYNTIEASNRQLGKSDEITFFPFSIIDTSHYKNVVKKGTIEDILNYRRTLFLNRLSSDLDNNNEGYIYEILARHNPSYIEIYNLWTKIRDVIRKGWLNRRVSYLYAESDSTHSIQMLALASVCMHIYNLDYLDKQKVYEMIIIHEIAEAIVGDIVEGSAEHLTKSERERIAIYEIFKNLKNKDYFINLWEEFENRQTEEAKFVYEIDKLDPVLKAKYLDRKLKRDDLFEDFYDYEDNRGTFIDTPLQKLFYSNMY